MKIGFAKNWKKQSLLMSIGTPINLLTNIKGYSYTSEYRVINFNDLDAQIEKRIGLSSLDLNLNYLIAFSNTFDISIGYQLRYPTKSDYKLIGISGQSNDHKAFAHCINIGLRFRI